MSKSTFSAPSPPQKKRPVHIRRSPLPPEGLPTLHESTEVTARAHSLPLLLAVLPVFFLGLFLLLYPLISTLLASRHQLHVVQEYEHSVQSTDAAELASLYAAAQDYNRVLYENHVVVTEPFDPTAIGLSDDSYYQLLDDPMAYIEIPAIALNLPIYHGTSEEVLSIGVGHLDGSSLPVGGANTHAVLSAHSGLPTKTLFTNLNKLQLGDLFYIHVLDQTLSYVVEDISVVLPTETESLRIQDGEDRATLVTCTPYGVNTHRLLVHGKRTEYVDFPADSSAGNAEATLDGTPKKRYSVIELVQGLSLALAFVLVLLFLWLLFFDRPKAVRVKRTAKHAHPRR